MAFSAADKHLFYTEMAKLLEAGFGIREAAKVMQGTRLPARQAALLTRMETGLEAGQSITEAFGADEREVSPLEKSIVGAGERGGRLAPAFEHLADYFGLVARSRREALASLVYPLVLLHFGVILGVVPAALIGGLSFGETVLQLVLALLTVYAGLIVLGLGIRALLGMAPVNAGIDRGINRIPLIGKARRSMAMARFTKVYHTGLLAGLPMRETVATATQAAHSGTIREAGRAIEKAAVEGNRLGPEFLASDAFPQAFARSYATAEEAGGLDKDLARWSTVFQEDAQRATKALAVAVPKVIYFLMLIFVAWKVISFYSGYYGALEQIGD